MGQDISLRGRVVDPTGNSLPGAAVQLLQGDRVIDQARSAIDGRFMLNFRSPGEFTIKAEAFGFRPVIRPLSIQPSGNPEITVSMTELAARMESVTVTADVGDVDVVSPDPAMKVFASEDLLDANPGRPGAPISIPGYPVETASSGIKAPQYFAPGVAGDHGEPIAQYIQVGSYLVPNNL